MSRVLCIAVVLLAGCNTGFQQVDGDWCFVTWNEGQGTKVHHLDVDDDTFVVMKNRKFAKDKNVVLFKRRIVANADPETFEVIGESDYAKDAQRVFLEHIQIHGADPDSFDLLEFPYARDKARVYCGSVPLDVVDAKNFRVLQSSDMRCTTTKQYLPRESQNSLAEFNLGDDAGVIYGGGVGRVGDTVFHGPFRAKPGQ